MDALVLCPSRGRPEKAAELRDSFDDSRSADSRLLFVVDSDDVTASTYERLGLDVMRIEPTPGGGMAGALNTAVTAVLALGDDPAIMGFVGDDHRFRSKGWDSYFTNHLRDVGGGFVYGHDRFWHNGELPTQIFISSPIVRELGWMALPGCAHLYLDNAWKDLAEAADCLYWMPNVVIEHMHPAVGKAEWDSQYRYNNSSERYAHDLAAFQEWRGSPQFEVDVENVRRHTGVPQPV